jgi:succinate-semialdehyde dehydrogenase / glutarate-semialdehyde dehydrogenase
MGCGWRGSAFHRWRLVQGRGGVTLPVFNPATGETIGSLAQAEAADLDRALAAADRGFKIWRKVSAYDRGKVLRKAGDLLRSRAEAIAPVMTREQGKPRAEPRGEVASGADILDWFAEEARRTYGRVIPAGSDTVQQIVTKEPVGPNRDAAAG